MAPERIFMDIKALEAKLSLLGFTDTIERTKQIISAAITNMGDITNAQAISLASGLYLAYSPVAALPEITVDNESRIWFLDIKPENREELKEWLEEEFIPRGGVTNLQKLCNIVHTVMLDFDKEIPGGAGYEWEDKALYSKDKPECKDYYINETPGIILVGYTKEHIPLVPWLIYDKYGQPLAK